MWTFSDTPAALPPHAPAQRRLIASVAAACMLAGSAAMAQDYEYAYDVGSPGTGPGQFDYPSGVIVDRSSHNIIVTDSHLDNVQIFSAAGTYLSGFGGSGEGNGQFDYPAGLRADPGNGHLAVTDYSNSRVQLFSSNGTYLSQFGSGGLLTDPCDIAIDAVTHHIAVSDGWGARVQIFDANGTYLSSFGTAGTGPGQFAYACGLAIDRATGHILVDDQVNNNVQVFSSTGTYLGQFGAMGSGDGEFSSPGNIAIDPVSRNIMVTDYGNGRVEIFSPGGQYLSEFGADGGLGNPIGIDIDPNTSKVFVVDRPGKRVAVFAPSTTASCGPTAVSISVDPPRARLSQSLLFSARAAIHAPFTGTMSFIVDESTAACVAAMRDVSASCLSPMTLGTHTVVAHYSGDGSNPPGCSLPQTVTIVADTTASPTGLGCIPIPDPPLQGVPVQFVCTLSAGADDAAPAAVGGTSPGGYVTFRQGDVVLDTVALSFGTATYTNVLAGGSYPITATYSGDAENASSSTEATIVVTTPDDDLFYGGFEIAPQ
jgi:DNA-binding beta-propeller fold protein YncE